MSCRETNKGGKEDGWQLPNWSEGSIVAASQLSSLALDSIPDDASSSNAAAVGDAAVGDSGLVGSPCSAACSRAVSYSRELLHRHHAATVEHCSTQQFLRSMELSTHRHNKLTPTSLQSLFAAHHGKQHVTDARLLLGSTISLLVELQSGHK